MGFGRAAGVQREGFLSTGHPARLSGSSMPTGVVSVVGAAESTGMETEVKVPEQPFGLSCWCCTFCLCLHLSSSWCPGWTAVTAQVLCSPYMLSQTRGPQPSLFCNLVELPSSSCLVCSAHPCWLRSALPAGHKIQGCGNLCHPPEHSMYHLYSPVIM